MTQPTVSKHWRNSAAVTDEEQVWIARRSTGRLSSGDDPDHVDDRTVHGHRDQGRRGRGWRQQFQLTEACSSYGWQNQCVVSFVFIWNLIRFLLINKSIKISTHRKFFSLKIVRLIGAFDWLLHTVCIHVDHECNGQTDGRTDGQNRCYQQRG